MDQKTFLKELAKHAQRNISISKKQDLNLKKVQIKTFKKKEANEMVFDSINIESLELYAEMMRDRFGNRNENQD